MKRTFNRTLLIPDLTQAKVKVVTFEGCKYTAEDRTDLGEIIETEYKGLTSWEIIEGGDEAFEIEKYSDIMDEFHEYLVLHFNDGRTSTFRNSHAELFIW